MNSELLYPLQYDGAFQRGTAKRSPPAFDWLRNKAVGCAESRLNPNVVSPRGAQGIMQWMPSDFQEWRAKCGYGPEITPFMAEPAIDIGCAYLACLYGQWTAKREEFDRWRLSLASYNAGLENILMAQKLADGATDYVSIAQKLSSVTGDNNAAETLNYVDRICRIHAALPRSSGAP